MKNGTSKQICTVRWFFILLVYCVLVGLLTESKMHFFWRGFLGIFFFSECAEILSSWKFGEGKIFLTFCSFVLPLLLPCFTILNKYIMHACFVFLLYQMYLKVCIRQKKIFAKSLQKKSSQSWKFMMASGRGFGYGKSRKMYLYLSLSLIQSGITFGYLGSM